MELTPAGTAMPAAPSSRPPPTRPRSPGTPPPSSAEPAPERPSLGVCRLCLHARRDVDAGQRQHFRFREPRGDLLNGQPPVLAAELRQVGYQDVDAGLPGERVAAAL